MAKQTGTQAGLALHAGRSRRRLLLLTLGQLLLGAVLVAISVAAYAAAVARGDSGAALAVGTAGVAGAVAVVVVTIVIVRVVRGRRRRLRALPVLASRHPDAIVLLLMGSEVPSSIGGFRRERRRKPDAVALDEATLRAFRFESEDWVELAAWDVRGGRVELGLVGRGSTAFSGVVFHSLTDDRVALAPDHLATAAHPSFSSMEELVAALRARL